MRGEKLLLDRLRQAFQSMPPRHLSSLSSNHSEYSAIRRLEESGLKNPTTKTFEAADRAQSMLSGEGLRYVLGQYFICALQDPARYLGNEFTNGTLVELATDKWNKEKPNEYILELRAKMDGFSHAELALIKEWANEIGPLGFDSISNFRQFQARIETLLAEIE